MFTDVLGMLHLEMHVFLDAVSGNTCISRCMCQLDLRLFWLFYIVPNNYCHLLFLLTILLLKQPVLPPLETHAFTEALCMRHLETYAFPDAESGNTCISRRMCQLDLHLFW